jgi:hypothetical protein
MKYKMLALLAGVVLIPIVTALSWQSPGRAGSASPTQTLGQAGSYGTGSGGTFGTGEGGMTGEGGTTGGGGDMGGGGTLGTGEGGGSGSLGTYTGPTS